MPFVSIGALPPQPSGVGSATTFSVTAGTYPTCEHTACIKCGNPNADCTPIKAGCDAAGTCIKTTCCDDPGFVLPALFITGVNVCSRTVQTGCGSGVVNTSRPQTGDNFVAKEGDTTDPGTDCTYGTGDDPAPLTCDPPGAGSDTKGKVTKTLGDGSSDAPGVHLRLNTPSLSTAWAGDTGGCPTTATFDPGEFLLTQLPINTESTTAGARAAFVDSGLDGDTCDRAGQGFGTNGSGPVTIPSPPAAPVPYATGGGAVSVAASTIFSSQGLAGFDIGYIAVTSNSPITLQSPQACSCTPTAGCPE
jgi:hypothetical protein